MIGEPRIEKVDIFLICFFVAVVTVIVYIDRTTESPKCVDTARVGKIVELKYRDAVVELTDGRRVTVNQATLKPGDQMCVRYSDSRAQQVIQNNTIKQ